MTCNGDECNGLSDLVWPDGTVFSEAGTVFPSIEASGSPDLDHFYVKKDGTVVAQGEASLKYVVCQTSCLTPVV